MKKRVKGPGYPWMNRVCARLLVLSSLNLPLAAGHISWFSFGSVVSRQCNAIQYSGPCDQRPPLLRSLDGLSWGCGLIPGCKMHKKYYLVQKRGGHIRQVGLTTGGLSSQGPLYMPSALYFFRFLLFFFFSYSQKGCCQFPVYLAIPVPTSCLLFSHTDLFSHSGGRESNNSNKARSDDTYVCQWSQNWSQEWLLGGRKIDQHLFKNQYSDFIVESRWLLPCTSLSFNYIYNCFVRNIEKVQKFG